VSGLLDAGISKEKLCHIVGCKEGLVYKGKRLKKAGKSLKRRIGSGTNNRIRSDDFLTGVASMIEADHSRSLRKLPKIWMWPPSSPDMNPLDCGVK